MDNQECDQHHKRKYHSMSKKKEVFLDAHQEFLNIDKASTSTSISPEGPILEMLERFDQLFRKEPVEKVSKLKEFFKSCLAIIQDKDVVAEFIALIEEPQEEVLTEIRVNHIGKILKTGRELRMIS